MPLLQEVKMTLLELINEQIDSTPNAKAIKSLKTGALKKETSTFRQVLNEELINKWIEDGLLEYSRTSKNRLIKILDILEVSEIEKIVLIHKYEERKGKPPVRVKNPNNKIPKKTEVISVTTPNGTELKGTLVWWSKDYNIYLNEPFEAKCGGGHLLYAAPAVYVLTDTVRKGVTCIPLLENAKEALIRQHEISLKNQT